MSMYIAATIISKLWISTSRTGAFMKAIHFKSMFAVLLLVVSQYSAADVYTDDLAKCLVESSSPQDKLTLVEWMFTAMSLHPQVESMAAISKEKRASANKNVANLFARLLTETCVTQAKKAVQYEGGIAIQSSFRVFGQVAARELFAHPNVAAGLADLDKYIDKDKLNSTLGLKK